MPTKSDGSAVFPRIPHRTPNAWRRLDVLAASLTLNLLALALPMSILQVYDRIIPNSAGSTFQVLLSVLVVVALLEFGLRVMRSVIMSWHAAGYDHAEGIKAIDRLMHADSLSVDMRSQGYFLDRVRALDKIQEFYSGQAMLLVMDFPFVVVFLAVIFVIAGKLVLVPLCLLLLFLLVAVYAGSRLHRAIEERSMMEERRQNFLIEILQGIHTIKSMAMEAFMLRRYERLQGQSADSVYKLARINSVVEGVGASFAQLAVVSFVSTGAFFVIDDKLSIGALAAGTMLSGRVLQPGIRAMGVWSQFQTVRLAREKVRELFEFPQEKSGNFAVGAALQGHYELDSVSFNYPGTNRPLLRDVNLKIKPGEAIAITGNNGSGKSTLLRLMAGFLKPDSGHIKLDHRHLLDYKMADLRSEIAVMPQQGVLFEGTILENMTLYREGAAVQQAIELARILGLDEIVSRLPEGLDTKIAGAAMDNLPEGVKQKIIIIRSLVGDPHVILFDDANANLDLRNDQHLLRLIKRFKGSRTLVIVTHRPSYMNLCDRRFELDGGRLHSLDRVDAEDLSGCEKNMMQRETA